MTEKLKQTIKEEIEKRPKDIQNAINAVNWVGITEEIGNTFVLSESELTSFQVETLLVLVGIQSLDFYPYNIETSVGTSKNQAEEMAREVFEKVFKPITDIFQENIKKNLGIKKPKLEQDLNFILSGGDYSAFMDQPHVDIEAEREQNDKISGYTANTPPKMMDMKNKFLYDNDKNI